MCGIAGFVGAGDARDLERMTAAIAHRGPDDCGRFVDSVHGLHFGFRRLAILDIEGGRQPMTTADGALTVVFNGQIYNWRELRAELSRDGAVFRSDHSDTEVLLHGYRAWGDDLPLRLNGMWSFAIYDRPAARLFFSRDRFGKKPLFYSDTGAAFVFASELGAMRAHPCVATSLDDVALRKYFAYGYVPAPRTLLSGVCKLPAGHSLSLDARTRRCRVTRYWRYDSEPTPEPDAAGQAALVEEFGANLERAVARRLVADVPVGCFLSGGIDSSTITALAARHAGQDRVKAFSIGFDDATFDETRHARRVAEQIGADHQVETLSLDKALALLPELAARLDEPIADSSLLPTFLLCRHARRQVTVALGGDGADELLCGYDPFRALGHARRYERWVPKPVHRAIAMLAARLPVSHRYMSLDFRIKRTLRGLDHPQRLWLPVWMAPLAPAELAELFESPVDLESLYSEAIEAWETCATDDPVERAVAFYVRLYLQDDILVKVDRASMLNSLEVRAPFLDIELVDFIRRLPVTMKLRGGATKWILRRWAETLLPREVIARPKQGFAVPIGRWLREGLLPPSRHPVNPAFWSGVGAAHTTRRRDQKMALWADWMLDRSTLVS